MSLSSPPPSIPRPALNPRQSVRALAARILRESDQAFDHVFVDEVLDRYRTSDSDVQALDGRDRALLQALVFGVVRWRRPLDWLIDACAQRVHVDLRNHVRLALFQMRYMDRIPRHAAVYEAVELSKTQGRRAAGFVNALLRKAADLPLPADQGIRASHPDWLLRRWQGRFPDLDAVLTANNSILPVMARVNRLRAPADLPVVIEIEGDPAAYPGFAEGHFTVQDETFVAVAPLLDPKPGQRILDLCAAPGGKTTHLAELMAGQGVVVAVDLPHRLPLVHEAAARLGLTNVQCLPGDGAAVTFTEPFDAVLVDAPCSNTGVLARRPDARWRLRERDIAGSAHLQRRLLTNAIRALRRGGRLVYATCSLEPEENRLEMPGLQVVRETLVLPTARASGGFMAVAIKTDG